MRLAEIDDWRRRLGLRGADVAPVLSLVKIVGVSGLDGIDLSPGHGFLTICGGTGSGKSALLHTIHAGLSAQYVGRALLSGPRFCGARIELKVSHPDGAFECQVNVGQPAPADSVGYEKGARLVGLADRTSLPSAFFQLSDVSVLKEGITATMVSHEDLAIANAVCRKEFESILIYEVDGPGDVTIPFFEVVESGHEYNSISLSTGELSALYIMWAMKTCEPFSILLVEEPEAFLPAISHGALFGMVSRFAVQRNAALIISTHSPTIASNVEKKNLVPLSRHKGQSKALMGRESKTRSLSRLGLKPTKHAILLVEDDLAKSILAEIKGIYEFDAVCNIEIVDVGRGDGGVKKALDGLPDGIRSVRILGVLDGDMKSRATRWKCKESLIFLPFTEAAEVEFLREADADPAQFGQALHRSEQVMSDALEATRGANSHDRFNALPAALGHTKDVVRQAALSNWMRSDVRKADVLKFAKELAARLGVTLPDET